MITMDFVEGLPRSKNHNCILVIVDKFSKYAHFLPLTHPFTTLIVAHLFMDHIYKLHGMPCQLFLIEIGFLPVIYGKNYSNYQAHPCA
jgi:hypothetical protein